MFWGFHLDKSTVCKFVHCQKKERASVTFGSTQSSTPESSIETRLSHFWNIFCMVIKF